VVKSHGGLVFGFGSILNRSGNDDPFGMPYEYLLSLDLDSYEAGACPLCRSGVGIDSPGSRHQAQ
jgi:orotate phosphoribosyltransferase